MYIDKFDEIPAEVLKVIREEFIDTEDIETIDEIAELIREASDDYDETTDSCYITCTYHVTRGDWRFEVDGNSYRKDQSVCDEELDEGFTVISLSKQKDAKTAKKKADRAKSDENWRSIFSKVEGTMQPEDMFNMLKDYKFPKKW